MKGMKLNVDFSALWGNISRMGAERADFSIEINTEFKKLDIDTDLMQGIDISLDEVEFDSKSGLASYKGRQVLLYISDHSYKGVEQVRQNAKRGNKFHVSHCKTLEDMQQKNRSDRYVVTNRLDGKFKIFDQHGDAYVELKVCQNCLHNLNYQGFRSNRQGVFNSFDIDKFFESYSSFFKFLPKRTNASSGYAANWQEISQQYRKSKHFCCEQCGVDLREHTKLLHTHHKNGVKSDNSYQNLEALCIDCHKKQPFHGHMKTRYDAHHADIQKINQLRQAQGKMSLGSWSDVEKFADTGLNGLLALCEAKNLPLPTATHYQLSSDTVSDLLWQRAYQTVAVLIQQEEPFLDRGSYCYTWSVKGAMDNWNAFTQQVTS